MDVEQLTEEEELKGRFKARQKKYYFWSIRLILGFPAGSDDKESACNSGDLGLIPGLGRSPGEGNGNPLQYSGLESPMDRGAWWATVPGVTQSQNWSTVILCSPCPILSFNSMLGRWHIKSLHEPYWTLPLETNSNAQIYYFQILNTVRNPTTIWINTILTLDLL